MTARLSTPPSLPRVPEHSWILRSRTRARLFAALAGLGVTAVTTAACWFFYQAGQPPLMMIIASDVFAGVLAALLIAGVLGNILDRSDALRSQLETIAEMNHHVRNALQLISFSAYQTHDQEAIATMRQGSERIEWALREILEPGAGAVGLPPPKKPPAGKHPRGKMSA
jgi:NAD/NADP transhydrogenase beta subunit